MAEALAEVMRNGFRQPDGGQGPRPAPSLPLEGASRPPGRALSYVGWAEAVQLKLGRSGRGNAVRFLFRPNPDTALAEALAEAMRWRISPPDGAPKPPASALPPLGGRFSPSRSGACLYWLG